MSVFLFFLNNKIEEFQKNTVERLRKDAEDAAMVKLSEKKEQVRPISQLKNIKLRKPSPYFS